MIKVENLSRVYGSGETQVHALKSVSLEIKEGEFVAVMGSSGSGKSTLMNILGCLDSPTSGSYYLAEQEIQVVEDEALSQIRNQKIGFIFQTFHLLTRLTALENVILPLRYSNAPPAEAKARGEAMLKKVGLDTRAHHKPFEMSGGQRQRVAIARALINEPKVIFADEPTGNLDSKTSHEIMELLCQLHQQGHTIVMVTHEDDIAHYAQRIVHMKDGEKVEDSVCALVS
ncbi:ABC transporter ATP-binding protein [Pseudoalteromonas piscicida]|uniref:Macrolide ABC transporter ATP-binding protein n=1 Tax=Pseudoalteromonas piscicida TaxID=43662 RepID=A0A2A5JL38_PSEO7|nr:ABC transporter ATP-binding protein [Pseudoalteromonas piscicida]PCK30136.1 macrolide ABC transporter ATP-binding protein [Pseudoalteromonas piscicida]